MMRSVGRYNDDSRILGPTMIPESNWSPVCGRLLDVDYKVLESIEMS